MQLAQGGPHPRRGRHGPAAPAAGLHLVEHRAASTLPAGETAARRPIPRWCNLAARPILHRKAGGSSPPLGAQCPRSPTAGGAVLRRPTVRVRIAPRAPRRRSSDGPSVRLVAEGRRFEPGRRVHAAVAHQAEQRPRKAQVVGSRPTGGSQYMPDWPRGRGARFRSERCGVRFPGRVRMGRGLVPSVALQASCARFETGSIHCPCRPVRDRRSAEAR